VTDYLTRSESETEAVGVEIAARLASTDVVYLSGELGAGKTAFARGVARGLGALPREVASPTFALLHEYAGENGRIVLRHLDLYRVGDDPRALEAIGVPDGVAEAPAIVEWPNAALRAVLPPTVEVGIETQPDESRRIVVTRAPEPGVRS
jgi:tRNA threonylcarbamoyladenosine biosynthesis protein TsaE